MPHGRGGWTATNANCTSRTSFVRGGNILRRGQAAVGDHRFLGKGFVGLMKLQLRLVTCAHIPLSGGFFQMDCPPSPSARRAIRQRPELPNDKATAPAPAAPASRHHRPGARDRLVYHFFLADRIWINLSLQFPGSRARVPQTAPAGSGWRSRRNERPRRKPWGLHRGHGLFKCTCRVSRSLEERPSRPVMRSAQQILVLGELVHQIIKCRFHRGYGRRCRTLRRQLSCWQPQVQRYHGAFAPRVLLKTAV